MMIKKICYFLSILFLLEPSSGNGLSMEGSYRDVGGYMEGFVAVGDAGKAIYTDFNGQITTIITGVEVNLTCVKRWNDGLIVGGADGTILKSDKGFSFDKMSLGSDDIVGIDIFDGKIYAISKVGMAYISDNGVDWVSFDTKLVGVVGIAANENCLIAATENGNLWFATKNDNRWMDYNAVYDGFAQKIKVKGIASDGERIWLLGENENGEPMAVNTDSGDIWYERSLEVYDAGGELVKTHALPLALVYNNSADQRMLLCENGQILTLTSCEQCNQPHDLDAGDLFAGDYWYGYVCVVGEDGFLNVTNSADLRQNKISGEQAAVEFANGGYLVDVNSNASYEQRHVKGSKHILLDEVMEKLPVMIPDRNAVIIFYCTAGVKSQLALETAQTLGYTRVYSMGGIDNWPYEFESNVK